jgi:CRP-like cAMP-binding protein
MATPRRVTVGRVVGDVLSEITPARPRGLGRQGATLLRGVPLFEGLSTRHLRRVASVAEEVRYGPNRTIVRKDARGDSFFVIAEGSARVLRGTRTIGRLGPGAFFGEMALVDGEPRTASVISETPLRTIRLTRAAFNRVLDSEPSIARAIMVELARRIRRLESTKG